MPRNLKPTKADGEIQECLAKKRSFSMIAGAGSGKTTSLITALEYLRSHEGTWLRQNGQKIVCITYTNRAVDVISSRLGYDDIYIVSTLHKFLWDEIKRFNHDIREALRECVIPKHIEKAREKDTGTQAKSAVKARAKVARLEAELAELESVPSFDYDDNLFSDYLAGELNHDDVIDVAGYLLAEKVILRRALGFKYPYIFVDEAQDTFENIVNGLNLVCAGEG